jgi:uncharacterized protein GlcG (DUF336 family)
LIPPPGSSKTFDRKRSPARPQTAGFIEDYQMMFRPLMIVSLACVSALIGRPASAESLASSKQLSLSIALEAAQEAVSVCEKSGYRVTATIVDASGLVKAVAKGDKAPPHTLDSSRGKAYAAVSLGSTFSESTTSAIVARVGNSPAFGPLTQLPGVFMVAGGVVIKSGDDVIGAIGVGGAPGGDKDEVCAQAAVAKIADRIK